MDNMERRMIELERRVALLEAHASSSPQPSDAISPLTTSDESRADRCRSMVQVGVSNKRYDPVNTSAGTYEAHIWFDCLYTPSGLSKPTRAAKGLLEFADHFGEVKFQVHVTLNETLSPGRPLLQKGIGFAYNQFLGAHQWMLATNVSDMKCALRLTNVLYTDGTTEAFA